MFASVDNFPAGTRRRIDVEYWLYLRRDVGQRIYNVFTTSDCRRRNDIET